MEKNFKELEDIFEEYVNRFLNNEQNDEARKLNFTNKNRCQSVTAVLRLLHG